MHVLRRLGIGRAEKLKGRDFFELKLVRVGLHETNTFFRPKSDIDECITHNS